MVQYLHFRILKFPLILFQPKKTTWQDLVQELRDLPRNVCVRRVNEVVARARAVKVHMALGAQAAGDGFLDGLLDSTPK